MAHILSQASGSALFSQPIAAQQRSTRARNFLITGLVFEVLVLLLLITVPPILNARAAAVRDQADTLQRLSDHLDNMDGQLQDLRAAARGYALTRSEIFLEQYELGQSRLSTDFAEIERLVRQHEPSLEARIIELRQSARAWQRAGGDRQIALAQEGQTSIIAEELAAGTSQALFGVFRSQSSALHAELAATRADLFQRLSQVRTLQVGVTSGLSLLGLLTVGLVVLGFRQAVALNRDLEAARQRSGHLAEQVAKQLAIAETRNRQVTALHAIAAAPSRSIQRDECIQSMLEAIIETLHLSGAALCLREAPGIPSGPLVRLVNPELIRARQLSPASSATTTAALQAALTGILRTMAGQPPRYLDPHAGALASDDPQLADLTRQVGAPMLLLPLCGRGEDFGVLVLIDPARRLSAADQPFFTTLATEIGLVLDNTMLFATAQAERKRLQAVFEHSPEGLVVAEAPDGQITLLNPAAAELFGALPIDASLRQHPLTGCVHQPGGGLCPPEDLPMVRTFCEGGAQHAVEQTIARPDGQRIPVLVTSVPFYDDSGTLSGVVGIFQDLRRLRELERLKSDLMALVNYELRTPLATIQGGAEALLGNGKAHDPERVRTFARIIEQQSEQLQELIDNLLNLSQIEAGALRLQRQNTSLTPLLRNALAQARERMPDLRLQANLETDLLPVNADPRRIEQVLQHLLDNAAKYSPPDGVITISAQISDRWVQVSVRDQGPGIPFAERERVFNRFYQLDRPTTRKVGGTGLGLALCKALIEAHGGTIWIDEAPGGGTLAIFQLAALPAATPLDAAPLPTLLTRPAHDRTRILILDTDPALQRVLERGLQDVGFSVKASADPQAVLPLLTGYAPDLMLIDVMLPGIDGFSVCRQIREWSNIPIMMLTANSSEQDVVRGLRAGADDYITKPFRLQELLARIDAVLRRSQPALTSGELSLIQLEQLTIDLARHRVTIGQEDVPLTPIEYQILAYLARHAGQALTHEQILQAVWGEGYSGENNYLWVHIAHLRKKIEPDPRRPRFILTERGLGYRMARM
jgi:DNA-binding response OmpR family regulator/signal transduction histidine kinase/CHASE3 domain sensor protein